MFKRIAFTVLVLSTVFAGSLRAEQAVKILLLPVDIHAQQNLDYLKPQVADAMAKQLEKDGASIVRPKPGMEFGKAVADGDSPVLQRMAADLGADYVLWGSMTWIGKQFSLDTRIAAARGGDTPLIFYADGQGIENLPAAVKNVISEISMKVFQREKIVDIRVVGNRRIEPDAIRRVVKSQVGDPYLPQNLSEDIKAVYAMGYFDDVRIDAEQAADGKILVINVREKPTVHMITFKGNRVLEDDKIKENIDIKTGSILNIYKVQNNVRRIESLYREKNYHNVKVSYKVRDLDNNQGDLEFDIDEGEKVKIKEIRFEGNKAFSAKQLKKVMKTSEKGFWSWITSSGELNQQDLNQDVELLNSYYQNNGYIQAKVGEPSVEYTPQWIYITIKIDEGPRYKVGTIRVSGEMIAPEDTLMKLVKIGAEPFYSREKVRNDVLAISDYYADEGYAYADVVPKLDQDTKNLVVNIDYAISKGPLVYFEKIRISGNTKTRDKVIRRELQSYEQELFSGKKLKRGIRNLYRLDYFEDIKVNTTKGSEPDKMILDIEVKEKPTGTFSFGGGYSSVENFFIVGSVTQRNLFGRGQILEFRGTIGGVTQRYVASFTEPWLFDIPLSFGIDLYDQTWDYDTYSVDSVGTKLRLGYPIWDYTRIYLTYNFDISDLYDLTTAASDYFLGMEGRNTLSSLTPSIRYDSRDRIFNPTEGSNSQISVEYAGNFLGGTIGFTKYIAEAGHYFPLFWKTVGFAHAKIGYIQDHPGELLPPYDRFYLGGINSLRGFSWDELSPVDANGNKIGGDKYIQFNFEYIFPLIREAGLMGVAFYDTGNLYNDDQSLSLSDLRKSTGGGIRWYSPMGPIRLEYGYVLDRKENESGGRWEFTMGSAF
ncbi:outer membrane protein assembly factor BamA [Desulfatirhabdium butyrativorans]|uniref:outer membrane protein assembly factor BamA n=1 Tax=Desulfatirhabdium butyrativorans TaxID=340467 RepID=UPI0003FEF888|nr:outer membrane protein assembly factor BamA [Desulfatirhabdium butyrativorans]